MVEEMEAAGLRFVGRDETGTRMEIVELAAELEHPFFIGSQFHPEVRAMHGSGQGPGWALNYPSHVFINRGWTCYPLTGRASELRCRGLAAVVRLHYAGCVSSLLGRGMNKSSVGIRTL